MSCLDPLKAFTIGINEKTGNKKLKICTRDVKYLWFDGHSWIKCFDDPPAEIPDSKDYIFDFDYIPCGRCLGCRLARAQDWAVRCSLESTYHPQSWFVTLTYDDNSLPFNVDLDTGELTGKSTFNKEHLQGFIKRIRKNYTGDNRIKYLFSAEYGDHTLRSHYHAILFGLVLDDLVEYKKTDLGFSLYTSEFVSKAWSKKCPVDEKPDFYNGSGHPRRYLGRVLIAPVSFETFAYVARYTMKKAGDDDYFFYRNSLSFKEFNLMSLKPAIGYQYYEDHKFDIYKYDAIYLPDGKVFKPPKYYDKLFEREYPDRMAVIKENRKRCADIQCDSLLSCSDYDFDGLLAVKEIYLKERTKSLKRKEI